MKRILLSSLALLLLAPLHAMGQGACYPAGTVVLDTGRPANSASVRVCTSGSTGTPCTPAASLFTDPTLGTPLVGSPTITTDARGNYGFCAAAGVNYDLQISGTGITPLTIKNLPLPPTTPIAAASLTSSSANPANVGLIKMASSDCLDWRNNANTGNIQLCKNTSDALDVTAFSSVLAPGIVVNGANTGTGAAVTIGGTSSTTGGISVFVGALGSQNERLAVVPADGSTASVRVGKLSARALSAGFLTGTEGASMDGPTGAITGASLALGGGTALTTTNRTGTGNLVLATSPTLTTPVIGTTTISEAPRMTFGAHVTGGANQETVTVLWARFIPDKPITVTRVTVVSYVSQLGATTAPQFQVTDGTTVAATITIANSSIAIDSGALSANYAAGANVDIKCSTSQAGTTTFPVFNIIVEYKMQ